MSNLMVRPAQSPDRFDVIIVFRGKHRAAYEAGDARNVDDGEVR